MKNTRIDVRTRAPFTTSFSCSVGGRGEGGGERRGWPIVGGRFSSLSAGGRREGRKKGRKGVVDVGNREDIAA